VSDPVNHPSHYQSASGRIEVIDIIEEFNLGFHLGNVVKYVLRSPLKGAALQDLDKARWYLDREIKLRKKCRMSKPLRDAYKQLSRGRTVETIGYRDGKEVKVILKKRKAKK
jgi:hypothetical protein